MSNKGIRGQMSINRKLVDQSKISRLLTKMLIQCQRRCQWSADRLLIEGIDQHSTMNTFRTHDPNSLFDNVINGSGLLLFAIS